jgi:hypothetical protein
LRRAHIAEELTDVREMSDAFVSAAWSATMVGRYKEAGGFAKRGLELARGVDPGQYLYSLSWDSLVRFLTGDWDTAIRNVAEIESLESLDSDGLPVPFAAVAYAVAAFITLVRCDTQADRLIDLMQEYRRRQQAKGLSIGVSRMLMARCLARKGDRHEAQAWLDLQRGTYLGSNLEGACEVSDPTSDPEETLRLIALAREEANRGGLEALPAFADRLEARRLIALGDRTTASALLERSAATFEHLGSPWETARSWLLSAEISETSGASEEARQALAIFERLDAPEETTIARKLVEKANVKIS